MKYTKVVQCMLAAGILGSSAAAVAAPDDALVKARIKIFGIENVDNQTGAVSKHKVLYSWLSHNAAAVAMDGRVFMLESFVRRLEVVPGRTPFVIRDLGTRNGLFVNRRKVERQELNDGDLIELGEVRFRFFSSQR